MKLKQERQKMYKLSKRSQKELIGVHPKLAFVVMEAIKITKQDFMVLDGIRKDEEQRKLVDRGVSKTMDSYHLYGLAVDLVAWVDGRPSWDEKYYKEIAIAMDRAAEMHNIDAIDWGYDLWKWDMPHHQLTGYKPDYDFRKITGA